MNNEIEEVDFFGRTIASSLGIVAGILITRKTVLKRILYGDSKFGILVPKSVSLKPIIVPIAGMPEYKKGEVGFANREPIVARYGDASLINAVGLENLGADQFSIDLQEICGSRFPENKALMLSIFGSSAKDCRKVAQKLILFAHAFEINISCPNSNEYGQVIGQDIELVREIVKAVVSLRKPVFVKISPALDIEKIVKVSVDEGASGITAINTRGPEKLLHDGYPVLSNKVGGISGEEIFELGLKCVKRVRKTTDVMIFACGGISKAKHVKKYKDTGANFYGLGSRAFEGVRTDKIGGYSQALLLDYKTGTTKADLFLRNKQNMNYDKYKMARVEKLDEELFVIKLNKKIRSQPGQFVFTWIPYMGEKPFSVLEDNPLTLLIRKRGIFTDEIVRSRIGDTIYIRGPYGNSPKIKGKTLLVAGGTGVAGVSSFGKNNKEVVALFGAKNIKQFPELKYPEKIYFVTEDGSTERKGLVTDFLEETIEKEKPKHFMNCGPEAMVRKAIQTEKKYVDSDSIVSSIEFWTSCGIGVCGKCATGEGYRSCIDGTFLRCNQL